MHTLEDVLLVDAVSLSPLTSTLALNMSSLPKQTVRVASHENGSYPSWHAALLLRRKSALNVRSALRYASCGAVTWTSRMALPWRYRSVRPRISYTMIGISASAFSRKSLRSTKTSKARQGVTGVSEVARGKQLDPEATALESGRTAPGAPRIAGSRAGRIAGAWCAGLSCGRASSACERPPGVMQW